MCVQGNCEKLLLLPRVIFLWSGNSLERIVLSSSVQCVIRIWSCPYIKTRNPWFHFALFFSPYRRRTSTTMRTLKEQQTQRSRDEEQCRTFSLHHIPLSHMTMLFPVFWSGELHQSHLQPLSCTQNDIFLREREKNDSKYFSLIWSVFF